MHLQTIGHILALLVGVVIGLIGLAAIVAPQKAVKGYGVDASGAQLGYVRGMGVRDLFLSGAVLIVLQKAQYDLLSYVFFGLALVSFVDGLIVARQRSKLAFVHAFGFIGSLLFAFWILLAWN